MESNYSYFCLKTNKKINTSFLYSNITENQNKLWEWSKVELNDYFSVFKLSWIDLIKYKENNLYGQSFEVTLLSNNLNRVLVFTKSLSTLSLVRLFLKEKFNLETEIKKFNSDYFDRINESNKFSVNNIYIKVGNEILHAKPDYLTSKEHKNDLFAIEYSIDIKGKYINITIFCYGLVKLSYGLNKEEVVRLYDELEIFEQ